MKPRYGKGFAQNLHIERHCRSPLVSDFHFFDANIIPKEGKYEDVIECSTSSQGNKKAFSIVLPFPWERGFLHDAQGAGNRAKPSISDIFFSILAITINAGGLNLYHGGFPSLASTGVPAISKLTKASECTDPAPWGTINRGGGTQLDCGKPECPRRIARAICSV